MIFSSKKMVVSSPRINHLLVYLQLDCLNIIYITCDSCCSIDWVYHHNWGQRRGGCHYLQTKSSISGWRVETDTHPCSSCQEDRSSPLGGCWWTSCHGWWWRIENNLTKSLYITLRSTDLQTCLLILSHQSVIRMICKQFSLNTT